MSSPVEAVPTLELPSAALMQWSQMALLLAGQLAARREQLDRLAFSDEEHTARAHDLAELRDAVEPAVRAMTAEEIAQWPTSGSDDATGATAPVSAEVAPLNDRWALHATARVDDDAVIETWVSCREENLARGVAREILGRGEPEAVHRLDSHIQLGEGVVAQHAAARASAPPVDRDAMAAQIRSAWPADVAAAAVNCRAWPTLAERLAAAQHDGHDLTRLLGSMSTSRIPTARKPAAFASWMLDQATARGATDGGPGHSAQTSQSRHPDHDQIGSWIDQLDPASMIDRIGALGVLGYCGTPLNTRLVTRFPDLLTDAAHDEGNAVAAETLAAERERSAAAHQATVDDPTTPQREDIDAAALAGRDLHEAAAAHATAAESHGAANAAVARANVTLTAPGPATTGQATAQVTPPPHPQPITPTRTPLRRTR
jgi:hypothetical protein